MAQLYHNVYSYIYRKYKKGTFWEYCTMGKQRKLNEEVISCIMISMLDLLREKKFEKISIIEIIEHAGVSRNSFL